MNKKLLFIFCFSLFSFNLLAQATFADYISNGIQKAGSGDFAAAIEYYSKALEYHFKAIEIAEKGL